MAIVGLFLARIGPKLVSKTCWTADGHNGLKGRKSHDLRHMFLLDFPKGIPQGQSYTSLPLPATVRQTKPKNKADAAAEKVNAIDPSIQSQRFQQASGRRNALSEAKPWTASEINGEASPRRM